MTADDARTLAESFYENTGFMRDIYDEIKLSASEGHASCYFPENEISEEQLEELKENGFEVSETGLSYTISW